MDNKQRIRMIRNNNKKMKTKIMIKINRMIKMMSKKMRKNYDDLCQMLDSLLY